MRLVYDDTNDNHAYYLNGKRCNGISTAAKIIPDTYTLEQWAKRMVAKGMFYDQLDGAKLQEKLAVDPNDKSLGDNIAKQALNTAKAHEPADRGTQAHKVLEMVLLNKPEGILTAQQKRDAIMLRRTLDRYGLRPHDGLVEQIVVYPDHRVAGRFDAVLERRDGSLIGVDLKTGPNAVLYPQTTAVQLAMYFHAPMVSAVLEDRGSKCVVEQWRKMPAELDLDHGYVLLCEPDAEEGTLHELNIAHGWKAAQLTLEAILWRRQLDYGKDIAREVMPVEDSDVKSSWAGVLRPYATLAARAQTVDEVRTLWREAQTDGQLTDDLKAALQARAGDLLAAVGA
jgi:hypothetical protein